MADTSKQTTNRIQEFGNQVGQATSNAIEGMKNVAENVTTRANEFVADASKRAETAGQYVSERADEATMAFGERMKAAGDASAQVGQRLKETGDYIEREGVEGLSADLLTLMKRNPTVTFVAGACLGFCLARSVSCRS